MGNWPGIAHVKKARKSDVRAILRNSCSFRHEFGAVTGSCSAGGIDDPVTAIC